MLTPAAMVYKYKLSSIVIVQLKSQCDALGCIRSPLLYDLTSLFKQMCYPFEEKEEEKKVECRE